MYVSDKVFPFTSFVVPMIKSYAIPSCKTQDNDEIATENKVYKIKNQGTDINTASGLINLHLLLQCMMAMSI